VLISIVVPVYNEKDTVAEFMRQTTSALAAQGALVEYLFINDGSTDTTESKIKELKLEYPEIKLLNLSRKFGKEAALTAGLDNAGGDVVIPIDCDLQDPPELINDMIERYQQGYDVVLAKRVDRSSDSFLKRLTASWFYQLIGRISHVPIPDNVGDFRLMSKRVVTALRELKETQRFMKGLFSWPGFKTTTIDYVRQDRTVGETSFNSWGLWKLALEGITSFSTAPLIMWIYIGVTVSLISCVYGSFIVFKTLFLGIDVPGYASLLVIVLFMGGIQLIGLGVLGEYIGRIYMEVKKRPIYIIESEF
jgi:glycosyltransferase involved in cell wall biosynthesis